MKVLLPIFLIFFFLNLFAQDTGHNISAQIFGRVIDSVSKTPVEYATITLLSTFEKKVVNETVTNKKGEFKLDSLEKGIYYLNIEYIGYKIKSFQVIIKSSLTKINLNDISLLNMSVLLNNITIRANAQLIENKIDKIVYNVEKDISSQGSVATDVLKKIPQVSVDIDGNVSLQGNSNIRFLINGKPSSIFGSSLADALQVIPASQIQSIEVITNPGVKYEAEGTAGIINIVLKNNTLEGLNANVNATAGTRLENGSLNFNYRHSHFSMNAYLSGTAQINSTSYILYKRHAIDSAGVTNNYLQNGNTSFNRNGFQAGTGFDWILNAHNDLNATFSYENYNLNNHSLFMQEKMIDSINNIISDVRNERASQNHFNSHSFDFNVNYKKTFAKENQELDFTYIASIGRNYIQYFQSQFDSSVVSPFSGMNSNNPGTDHEFDFIIDYTHPLSDALTIQTGIRNDINSITSSADVQSLRTSVNKYFFDSSQSYNINYKRKIYAFYISGTFKLLKILNAEGGIRYEYTTTSANFLKNNTVSIPSYSTIIPSFILYHSFPGNSIIKIAFAKRIERPDYRDLNPFMNMTDPHNITTGNPALKPEIGNKSEIDFTKSFQKGINLTASLYYNVNTQDIKSYSIYYPQYKIGDSTYSNVSVTSRQNINSEKTTGLNIYGSIPFNTKFSARTNLTIANRNIINSYTHETVNGYEYRINTNLNWQLSGNIMFEAFVNYNSRVHNVQGWQPQFLYYNLAFRKQFWAKKGSIAILATNPFNKYVNQKTSLSGPGFTLDNLRMFPLRSFGINFTYKLGNLEFKKAKEAELNPLPSVETP